jgi:NTP pyrophosphatase (non-canonical NTP hydrolase)
MELNEFQKLALKTRLHTANAEYIRNGLVAEVGEYLGHYAKMQRDGYKWGYNEYKENQRLRNKEIGDILWFVAALAEDEGMSLEAVAQGVINKLQDRATRNVLEGSGDDR